MAGLGYIDITRPPYSCDPTGAVDATEALQSAVDFGRRHYLVVGIPPGRYTVTRTIKLTQPTKWFHSTVSSDAGTEKPDCNNMVECDRLAPGALAVPASGLELNGLKGWGGICARAPACACVYE